MYLRLVSLLPSPQLSPHSVVVARLCPPPYHNAGTTMIQARLCVMCVLCMRDHHDTGEGVCVCVLCMRDHHDKGEGVCVCVVDAGPPYR